MKLKFKVQPYQTNAVNDVVDCFAGQPMSSGLSYRIDPGRKAQVSAFDEGFKNADLKLSECRSWKTSRRSSAGKIFRTRSH